MAKTLKINVVDLLVNTENYRFEPVDDQNSAIEQMVEDQGDKLVNLAESILEYGLNPNDPIQACRSQHDKKRFNVLEGNRRVVSLKLLNNPRILDGINAKFKNKFTRLHDANKHKIAKVVSCTVYDDPKEADVWIGIKHGYGKSGVGTDSWDPIQKGRFEEQVEGKSSTVLQVIKYLKNSPDASTVTKSNLAKVPVSSLQRLINDPDVRKFVGIEINNGTVQSKAAPAEVAKGLSQIIDDLVSPGFKVSQIYTKDDRGDYLKNFNKGSRPNLKKQVSQPWKLDSPAKPVPPTTPKPKPIPTKRDTLIPKSCALSINNAKLNYLYSELKKISLSRFPNVTAVAFRTFVENSMDCYISANNLKTTKSGKPLNKDSKLLDKIVEVANDLEKNKGVHKHICKGIRNAAHNKNDLLGIETLHAYVHNPTFSAIPSNLIITWDNIQAFMENVWGNIK